MKVFDGHSDIFIDITKRRKNGETNVFKNQHLDRLRTGNVTASILVGFINTEKLSPDNYTSKWLDAMGAISEEIDDMKEFSNIVHKGCDLDNTDDKISIILGMEGLAGLHGNISLINMLYKIGFRHAMFTWNEENEFATGAGSSNVNRGLTPLGVQAVKRMEDLGMIVDVSHANEKTFWDIYENTEKPFIASHSNVYSLCPVKRNLKDDQIKAIAQRGGVIGMNSVLEFIDSENPTAEKFIDHIDYIADLVGIDHIGFGFDFCEFLDGVYDAPEGIRDATQIPNFINLLSKRGYKEEDIKKIAWGNFERVIKSILK